MGSAENPARRESSLGRTNTELMVSRRVHILIKKDKTWEASEYLMGYNALAVDLGLLICLILTLSMESKLRSRIKELEEK